MAPRKKAPKKTTPRKRVSAAGQKKIKEDLNRIHISLLAQFVNLCLIVLICIINNESKHKRVEAVESRFLAWEMRNSTDYLTDHARSFVVTDDPGHMTRFEEELKRRTNFATRVKDKNFTPSEVELIQTAFEESQQLAKVENEAFELQAAGKKEEAVDKLYCSEYYTSKKLILANIDKFMLEVQKRTGEDLAKNFKMIWIIVLVMFLIELWSLKCILDARKVRVEGKYIH